MTDVAIVGIGIHPFGRTDGVSGLQQGVHAAKEALSDAEIEWKDIECYRWFGITISIHNYQIWSVRHWYGCWF